MSAIDPSKMRTLFMLLAPLDSVVPASAGTRTRLGDILIFAQEMVPAVWMIARGFRHVVPARPVP